MLGCWTRWVVTGLTAIGSAAGVASAENRPANLHQVTLFHEGQGPYNNYRIPAVVRTTRGAILAFCEGRQTPLGPGNDTGDIDLILRRSTDGGHSFSPPQLVWSDADNTCGNPCPVVDSSTGTIWLLSTHNLGRDHEKQIIAGTSQDTRTVWVTSSDDDGQSWSPPRDITSQVKRPAWRWFATGPGVGIQLKHGPHAGRLVIPCDYATQDANGKTVGNSLVIFSDDHGKTWRPGGESPAPRYNESQVVELPAGRLMLNMRNYAPGMNHADQPRQRGVCLSDDGGATFDHLRRDPALVEPSCQGSILRYSWPDEGRSRILFANPASETQRVHMTVRLSYDEGKTWPVAKQIFDGYSCYSSLVTLPAGRIGLLYEAGDHHRYERIDFATFDLNWLTDGQDHPEAQP